MAGLSATLFHSASIDLIGDHSAAAKSGSSISGRALSDTAHGSTAGLRYLELELTQLRTSSSSWFGAGFTDVTSGLTTWIGGAAEAGVYVGAGSESEVRAYVSGGPGAFIGTSLLALGTRIGLWLDPSTRRVWVSTRPRNGWLVGVSAAARPDLGTGEQWTVGGTAAIRFAVTPGFGSGSDRNVVRARTRYGELLNGELYGARPWDAREVTISGTVNTAHASVRASLRWAWFDHASPHLIVTAPTSVGTLTVGSGGAYSISVWTSLDAGQVGSLLLMRDDGDVVQARAHYMPRTAP